MGASFLITLREGLEIALVLVILIGYLVKSGRETELAAVWRGAGSAIGACVVAGVAVFLAVGGLHGKVEQAVEGVIALAAASVLTWMIFWMRANSRHIGGDLQVKVDAATGATALATIAFVAVVREGLETVLFLLSAEKGASSGAEVVVGGLLGVVVAAVLGVAIYRGSHQLNLRRFFQVTGVLLILFAAGLAGKAFHEFRELFGFESGGLVDPAWTITSGVWAKGTFYDFMKGFFGWHAETEKGRLLVYIAYLVPVLYLFLKGPKPVATTAREREAVTVG